MINPPSMTRSLRALAWCVAPWLVACGPSSPAPSAPAADRGPPSALTVNTVRLQTSSVPIRLTANGNVSAWQEALVGSQSNGLPLKDVLVNVGDVVQRGQALARFDAATVQAEVAQLNAAVAEAEALHSEAVANAQRARALGASAPGPDPDPSTLPGKDAALSWPVSGALSAQQLDQYLTAERTTQARLMAQRAALQAQSLRLAQAQVLAPDDGVISARQATVGAVVPAGQELFRLIRQGRLEWRAEVGAADLARLQPGMSVDVQVEASHLSATVRQVAPTLDPATRQALVYVDLPEPEVRRTGVKAGMFARGEFDLGVSQAHTLPQTAVMLRDGFSTVFRVDAQGKVAQTKVRVGRREGDRIEIIDGLPLDADVVASGGGFLADGDRVKVVSVGAAAPSPAASAVPPAAVTGR